MATRSKRTPAGGKSATSSKAARPARKAPAKKAAARSGAGAATRKLAAKKPLKATAKKATARKAAAKGVVAKKSGVARKAATKKAVSKRTAAKKPANRKSASKKSAARKTAPKKSATKKTTTRKTATRKTETKKVATRNASTGRVSTGTRTVVEAGAPKKAAIAKKAASKAVMPSRRPATGAKSRKAVRPAAGGRRKAPTLTPEQALARTRELLQAHQEHARETPAWRQLEDPHAAPQAVGAADHASAEAEARLRELHAGESRMRAIQGSVSTHDRRNQRKRDHR